MANIPFEQELLTYVQKLTPDQQQQLLAMAKSLSSMPAGSLREKLLKLPGTISKSDLELMSRAIEEGCEQVDPDEW